MTAKQVGTPEWKGNNVRPYAFFKTYFKFTLFVFIGESIIVGKRKRRSLGV